MKSCYQCESSAVRTLLSVLLILFTLGIGPANAASEPGTVAIVLNLEPPNLDPSYTIASDVGYLLTKNVVETLTDVNYEDSSISPRLATSWKRIDANTWQFFLRKGVRFHDGADFNAEAVVFNINRLYDKRINSKTKNKLFSNLRIEGKALDSYTLEIKTDKPEPLLLTFMGAVTLCSPNTPLDKVTRNPIGTGPYRFVKWEPGMQIVLERFGGYWGKPPQVKKAIYVWRRESAVRAAMVSIGEADIAPSIAYQDATHPSMDYSYLNSETTIQRIGGEWEPPLNDRRVRMALNYALDRNAIRGSILSKDVIPATQLVAPNIFGHNPELRVWPYDPQKAKQLLEEARKDGVQVDKEISLLGRIGYFPGNDELIEATMTMYKAVGLNVKIRMFEIGVFNRYRYKPFATNLGPYILQLTHDNSLGDAVFTVFYNYYCKGDQSSMCDKTVDDLIEKAQVASGEVRRKLWQSAFKRSYEDTIPSVTLFHMVGFARVGKRINFKPTVALSAQMPLAEMTFKE